MRSRALRISGRRRLASLSSPPIALALRAREACSLILSSNFIAASSLPPMLVTLPHGSDQKCFSRPSSKTHRRFSGSSTPKWIDRVQSILHSRHALDRIGEQIAVGSQHDQLHAAPRDALAVLDLEVVADE